MKINIIRTTYPKKVVYDAISKVRKQLKKENITSQEKIKEIFSEIDADF